MSTSDPSSARIHARAQAGARVAAMPVLPASATSDLPAGIDPTTMLWEEVVAPGGYASHRLDRGARLRLVDTAGDACVSLLLFNAAQPAERLNVADTAKVQWNAYVRAGALLLSDMGRPLASILTDEAETHDMFCGPSTAPSNARRYGDGTNYGPHPNARDRFLIALAKHGLGRRDLHPCLSLFKGVRIAPDGAAIPDVGPFTPGRAIVLRAEMDLIVILANCPHILDPRPDYRVSPVRISAWRGPPTAPDDPIRNSGPEAARAFLNVDDYLAR